MKSHGSDPFFFSRKYATHWLGVSLRMIDLMVELGELPARRIGRRVVISRHALEDFAKRDHPSRPRRMPISQRSERKSWRKGRRHASTTER